MVHKYFIPTKHLSHQTTIVLFGEWFLMGGSGEGGARVRVSHCHHIYDNKGFTPKQNIYICLKALPLFRNAYTYI